MSAPAAALDGLKVVDLSQLTPGPYCTMLLADLGADVIRVDPPGGGAIIPGDPFGRGKRSISIDLKQSEGQQVLRRLLDQADVLVEGFRPGVAKRLGADAESALARNPRLIYCSITGWGQNGPLAHQAGHDINYLAVAGALAAIGRRDQPPVPPLNLVGDMGGGGLLAAFGILAAVVERSRSGQGQHIDAAMVDGAISLNSQTIAVHTAGMPVGRGTGYLDSGAPFYDTYETADGRFMAVGAIEAKFFREFWSRMGIDGIVDATDLDDWPRQKEMLRQRFLQHPRAHWEGIFDDADACVSPVLELDEAPDHPHNEARDAFATLEDGRRVPAPAPRLARTPGSIRSAAPSPGQHTAEIARELGFTQEAIANMVETHVLVEATTALL